ncbi:MAG: 2-oxo acid dehydrogenase subunit E2 [Desulfobacterales bacterium]|nr:MAG: 2-oxo acid dehydrogenase subunit E2 [Desulfobacterales bacterium]
MPKEFKLPDLGEGIHEGEIVEVLVSVGDHVEDGQSIMVIETDKATTEVPAPVTGIVKEIRVKSGDIVNVGDVLMTFTAEGEAEAEEAKPLPEETRVEAETAPEPLVAARVEGPVPAAPSVRRLARELSVDLRVVTPTGPGGRVTAEDVRAIAEKGKMVAEAPPPPAEERPTEPPAVIGAQPLPDFSQWGSVERIPLRSVRRTTAKRMALAWSQIPHVTHSDEADVTDLETMRQKHKADVEAKGGKLTLTVFALKAVVAALKAYPQFNTTLDMEAHEIILKHYYNIGVAVDTERGLLVPVVKHVDCKSINDLAKEVYELAERTRSGLADVQDMSGGTFTITNVGPLGGTGFTPIINYPQVAILGLGRTRLRPVVRGDRENFEIVPRLILPLALGFDHRVVDGADAARFMGVVINTLENPENLVMMA